MCRLQALSIGQVSERAGEYEISILASLVVCMLHTESLLSAQSESVWLGGRSLKIKLKSLFFSFCLSSYENNLKSSIWRPLQHLCEPLSTEKLCKSRRRMLGVSRVLRDMRWSWSGLLHHMCTGTSLRYRSGRLSADMS